MADALPQISPRIIFSITYLLFRRLCPFSIEDPANCISKPYAEQRGKRHYNSLGNNSDNCWGSCSIKCRRPEQPITQTQPRVALHNEMTLLRWRERSSPDPDLYSRVAALDVCQDCASDCILNQWAIKTNISLHFIKPRGVIASDTSRGRQSLTVHFFLFLTGGLGCLKPDSPLCHIVDWAFQRLRWSRDFLLGIRITITVALCLNRIFKVTEDLPNQTWWKKSREILFKRIKGIGVVISTCLAVSEKKSIGEKNSSVTSVWKCLNNFLFFLL